MQNPNQTIHHIAPAMVLGISVWDVNLVKEANLYENGERYDWFYDQIRDKTRLQEIFAKALDAHGENDTPMNLFAQFIDLLDNEFDDRAN